MRNAILDRCLEIQIAPVASHPAQTPDLRLQVGRRKAPDLRPFVFYPTRTRSSSRAARARSQQILHRLWTTSSIRPPSPLSKPRSAGAGPVVVRGARFRRKHWRVKSSPKVLLATESSPKLFSTAALWSGSTARALQRFGSFTGPAELSPRTRGPMSGLGCNERNGLALCGAHAPSVYEMCEKRKQRQN